jgi:hypothetical protein
MGSRWGESSLDFAKNWVVAVSRCKRMLFLGSVGARLLESWIEEGSLG